MNPIYRIETKYDPSLEFAPWFATVYRLSDGEKVYDSQASDEDGAIAAAQRYIARLEANLPTGRTLWADEHGELVPAPEPQSLRA